MGLSISMLVTAPSKGAYVKLVLGVNEHDYNPAKRHAVSVASCTTNGLAPIAKVLHKHFGIRYGMLNTIHS